MQVGFYDKEKAAIVEVERTEMDRREVLQVAGEFQKAFKKKNNMFPTPYWCAWDGEGFMVFHLKGGFADKQTLEGALAASASL